MGDSEKNIRAALAVAEAVGNCVLMIDEIEKALGGATSGAADGGVSSDALGCLLTWMQERKGSVFVIATANSVKELPPELLRKGRFDEMFFVDLPTQIERCEILTVALKQFKRDLDARAVSRVAAVCASFTGSEIAALVPEALFAAFAEGERPITEADLIRAAKATVPLASTAKEKVQELREWAKVRARPASLPEVAVSTEGDRVIDV